MKPLEVERHPAGYRVRFCGCRIHHGLVGLGMLVGGVWLMVKDIADFPWLRDW